MLHQLKAFARRSRPLIIAYKIYDNWRLKNRFAIGVIDTSHGSSHSSKTLDESVAYIQSQFQDYLNYGELTYSELDQKSVLELGFGDNIGVGLLFIAAGTKLMMGIDKFYSKRNVAQERNIYLALRETLGDVEKSRFDSAVDLSNGIIFNSSRINLLNGLTLEQATSKLLSQNIQFDLIISRAVLEEIYDPSGVLRASDRLLKPGGMMLHKIDLSDYGIFRDAGMHPLTFLTIPRFLYRKMSSDSGIPNRKLMGYYQETMKSLGYAARFFVCSTIGMETALQWNEIGVNDSQRVAIAAALIGQIRPRLCSEFKELSDEELMTDSIFIAAKKPAVES
jgi:SAM-dependent methyltransferase